MTTTIEWARNADGTAGRTWNPTTGCDRISPGCDRCYAMTLAKRLKAMGSPKYRHDGDPRTSGPGFGVTVHADAVNLPLRWRKPSTVFVNSMSDLFHHQVPAPWVADVFAVMAAAGQHTFQVLTKRPSRARRLLADDAFVAQVRDRATGKGMDSWVWPLPNVWLGTSTEDQRHADTRIPHLLKTPAAVRFISAEPLLGPLDLSRWLGREMASRSLAEVAVASGLDSWAYRERREQYAQGLALPALSWVIAGGESGPEARPSHPDWFRSLRDQCATSGVPYLFKQWGHHVPEAQNPQALTRATAGRALYIELDGSTRPAAFGARGNAVTVQPVGKARSGRRLDGRVHDDMPARHIPEGATSHA